MISFLKSLLILIPFAIVTVATSQLQETKTRIYSVTSNCGNASFTTGTITVNSNNIIESPANVDFTNLGFPTASVVVGADSSGDLAPALTRTCTHSSSVVGGTTVSAYTCSDNSIPSCTINLSHIQ